MNTDFERRLSASLRHGAHQVDETALLATVATSYVRAERRARRWRLWLGPAVAAIAVAGLVTVPLVLTQSQAGPVRSVLRPAAVLVPWQVSVTAVPQSAGGERPRAATSTHTINVSPRQEIALVVNVNPKLIDGKTYVEQQVPGGWITLGPHNTDLSGQEVLGVRAPAAGTRVTLRVRVVGAGDFLDGYSAPITIVASANRP
ncbi:MAG: hypothetical protein M3Y42_07575 [Actinomycetota bacterium]|nr:hypothetical protein [Actinomycetota bacterium]MDQ2956808.1 hypothetical protein [Actinomycetota bacterium]